MNKWYCDTVKGIYQLQNNIDAQESGDDEDGDGDGDDGKALFRRIHPRIKWIIFMVTISGNQPQTRVFLSCSAQAKGLDFPEHSESRSLPEALPSQRSFLLPPPHSPFSNSKLLLFRQWLVQMKFFWKIFWLNWSLCAPCHPLCAYCASLTLAPLLSCVTSGKGFHLFVPCFPHLWATWIIVVSLWQREECLESVKSLINVCLQCIASPQHLIQ